MVEHGTKHLLTKPPFTPLEYGIIWLTYYDLYCIAHSVLPFWLLSAYTSVKCANLAARFALLVLICLSVSLSIPSQKAFFASLELMIFFNYLLFIPSLAAAFLVFLLLICL